MSENINDKDYRSYDPTDRMRIIGEIHDMIHKGLIYVSSTEMTVESAAHGYVLVRTGASKVHFSFGVKGIYAAKVYLYEGPTISADGAPVDVINRDFNSLEIPTISIFNGPSVTDNGAFKYADRFGSGNKAGGQSLPQYEFILKDNTDYLIDVLSESNGNDIVVLTEHYEPGFE